jgi:hypothetical protein
MGQICSGQKGEAPKRSAVDDVVSPDDMTMLEQQEQLQLQKHQQQQQQDQQHHHQSLGDSNQPASNSNLGALQQSPSSSNVAVTSAKEKERLKALQLEQQRVELIVANAGRGMVSVRSTRGSTGYYDQGFAAALAQHLEQTTQFPNGLAVSLPPAPTKTNDDDKNDAKSTDAATTSAISGSSAATSSTSTTGTPGSTGTLTSSSADKTASATGDGTNSIVPGSSTTTADQSSSDKMDASSPGTTSTKSTTKSSLYGRLSQPAWEGIVLGTAGGLAGCGGENPHRYLDNVAESLLDSTLPAKQQLFAGVKPMVENLL